MMFQTTLLTRRIINNVGFDTAKNCVMRSDCQCANESAYSEAEARKVIGKRERLLLSLKPSFHCCSDSKISYHCDKTDNAFAICDKLKCELFNTATILRGNALTGLGYVVSNSIKLARPCHLHYWSPMKCLVSSPQLSFYAIGIPLETFGMFLIALDRFLTIIMANTKWKFNDHRVNRALFLTGTIVFGYAAALWVTACFRSNVLVTSCCFLEETAPKSYYLAYFGFVSALGYVGFCLFAIASVKYIFIKRKRMPIVQQQLRDIRYDVFCMKQATMIVVFTFLMQTVPNTVVNWIYDFNKESLIIPNIFAVCVPSYSLYAIYRLFTDQYWKRKENDDQSKNPYPHISSIQSTVVELHLSKFTPFGAKMQD
ncbi:hypothetical protein T12_3201 [Trichinella patagoniensis]|uniref:G-protein coupled receptors family 1 profile domain-containing protein n=4 Tax=Trichinella TaxID=6333 RepID=A0A0V1AAC3_9BILA|nr:hypothetical protein T12_3201 [Trichinella patagoniensis]